MNTAYTDEPDAEYPFRVIGSTRGAGSDQERVASPDVAVADRSSEPRSVDLRAVDPAGSSDLQRTLERGALAGS